MTTRDYAEGDAGWSLGLDGLLTLTVHAGPRAGGCHGRRAPAGRPACACCAHARPTPAACRCCSAELGRRAGPDGAVSLVVPGPHPALPDVLAMGARVEEVDLWCATAGAADLVDPTRELPSPALA